MFLKSINYNDNHNACLGRAGRVQGAREEEGDGAEDWSQVSALGAVHRAHRHQFIVLAQCV